MAATDDFTGFDQARHALWCYEARSHVYFTFGYSVFMTDDGIDFIHIDNTSRAERFVLTTFDANGNHVGGDIIYDDDRRGLDAVTDFVFDPHADQNHLTATSALAQVGEDGWIVDMNALRKYDIFDDRRATQRAMVLALLQDMIVDGDARCMLFGSDLKGSDASSSQ